MSASEVRGLDDTAMECGILSLHDSPRTVGMAIAVREGATLSATGKIFGVTSSYVSVQCSKFTRIAKRGAERYLSGYSYINGSWVKPIRPEDQSAVPFLESDVAVLTGLSKAIRTRLHMNSVYTVSELVTKSEIDLRQMYGIGRKVIKDINHVLGVHGLRLNMHHYKGKGPHR